MIYGIGTDIVAVERLERLYERHGERCLEKILSPEERVLFKEVKQPARFLAKRFASKEAFGKALGIGVVQPASMVNIGVSHDHLGKPCFVFSPDLALYLSERRLITHLTISDEAEYAVAFVIVESH